jgi:hypothetical protein
LERQPESRRLELNGYLTKPTSRLGRYNLLLNTIHQLTPKDHQDYNDIPKVIDKITEYLVRLNEKAGMSDNAFHLEQISSKILTKGQVKHMIFQHDNNELNCDAFRVWNYLIRNANF